MGIVLIFQSEIVLGSYFIWIAAVFDFLDGFAARALKSYSDVGKELDSLADIVSFGVLPGMIMFLLISSFNPSIPLQYLAFTIPAFAALRLAKFNVDDSQSEEFRGLPTPAAALTVSSFPFIINGNVFEGLNEGVILTVVTLIIAILMIAPITLISLKFKDLKWDNNKYRFIFAVGSIILLIIWKLYAFPLIVIFYLLVSIFSSRER